METQTGLSYLSGAKLGLQFQIEEAIETKKAGQADSSDATKWHLVCEFTANRPDGSHHIPDAQKNTPANREKCRGVLWVGLQ